MMYDVREYWRNQTDLDALYKALARRDRSTRIDIEKWHHYYKWLRAMGLQETATIIWAQQWS